MDRMGNMLAERGIYPYDAVELKDADDPELDEFFCLGDNSFSSLDGRCWTIGAESMRDGYRAGTVPRYNLIGKAVWVYWPSGFSIPVLNEILPERMRYRLVPNVGEMRILSSSGVLVSN